MPVFDTPEPVNATIEIDAGHIAVIATDRSDTRVDVRPTNPSSDIDVKAAESIDVGFGDGALTIRSVRGPSRFLWFGSKGSVDVRVEFPSGSDLDASVDLGAIDGTGQLGRCSVRTGLGGIRVDRAATLTASTGHGEVQVDEVDGHADITSGSGSIRVGNLRGSAVVKNSNGDTRIGLAEGDLRIKGANGNIAVERSTATVVARTANGSVRLADMSGGAVVAETSVGEIDLGVHPGVTAWLDLATVRGNVRQTLDTIDGPGDAPETIDVRARSTVGDIAIRRAPDEFREAV